MHLMYLAQAATGVATEDVDFWAKIVQAAIAVLITGFLLPFLKSKSEEAHAKASEAGASAKQKLLDRVKALAIDEAYIIAEQRLPVLAAKALAKELSKEQIKAELRTWGTHLRDKLVSYFKDSDGVDLAVVLGDKILDDIVRWAADKTSPFPGKETAVALLQDDWSNRLVNYGAEWVRTHWLDQKGS